MQDNLTDWFVRNDPVVCDNTLVIEHVAHKERRRLSRDNRTRDKRKRQMRTARVKRDRERDMGPYVPHATFVTSLPD